MTDVLYQWPAKADFGRTVPKTKFYEKANVNRTVREKFVDEVQRVTWAYKLAESTINLPGTDAVPEIQVFTIETKGADVSDDLLATIDRAVRFPIVFEVVRVSAVRMTAAQKRIGANRQSLSDYVTTGWMPDDTLRVRLPPALDLTALHAALLAPMFPIPLRPGETLADAAKRLDDARKTEREIARLTTQLRREPQLNRMIEIRRRLLEHQAAHAALIDPEPPTTEDATWTS